MVHVRGDCGGHVAVNGDSILRLLQAKQSHLFLLLDTHRIIFHILLVLGVPLVAATSPIPIPASKPILDLVVDQRLDRMMRTPSS